jgi:hypothetical protein
MDRAKMERSASVQQGYASFLMRVWREVDPAAPDAVAEWHGEIEHIQSGQRSIFASMNELQTFLYG